MEDFNQTNEEIEEILLKEEEKVSFTDKLVGIFTEPAVLFDKILSAGPKASDWAVPILLISILTALTNFIVMQNPEVKFNVVEKQMEKMQKNFDEAVEKGQMTQEQADAQMDRIREQTESYAGSPITIVFTFVGTLIFLFIFFFIISGFFFLVAKFALGGEGDYKLAMSAYGLPYYVFLLQSLFIIVLTLLMGRMIESVSIGAFLDADKTEFAGMILYKIDLFAIWFYGLVGLGFAKLFNSESTVKYIAAVYGIWIGFSIIFYFVVQNVPFLKFMNF